MQILLADPEAGPLDDVVDLANYPIHEPDSAAYATLVERARSALAEVGCLGLPGFLHADALDPARAEIAALAPKSVVRSQWSSVYARPESEATWPQDDPRRIAFLRTVGYLTRDQIPPDTAIARLYAAPAFKAFIAACVGVPRVFEYADPLAGLIVTVVPPDGELTWHYDTNEFVVTLMIQPAEEGGRFEYCPSLRRPGAENLDELGRVLRGHADDRIRTAPFRSGDLQIFKGRYSLHRVTRVRGRRARHVAALGYADRPSVIGPPDRTRALYGRVAEAHLIAQELGDVGRDGLIF